VKKINFKLQKNEILTNITGVMNKKRILSLKFITSTKRFITIGSIENMNNLK